MIVYRICHERFANQLTSSGRSNRWNRHAQRVIYTSGSISLCALELLAHTNGIRPSGVYNIMHIEIQEQSEILEIDENILPENWNELSAYSLTQQIGSNWYESQESLVMKIPSAIIRQESNFIMNCEHPDFSSHVRLKEKTSFIWDHRFPEN